MAILLRRGKGVFGGEAIFDRGDRHTGGRGQRRRPGLHQRHGPHYHPAAMDMQDRAAARPGLRRTIEKDPYVGPAVDRRDRHRFGRDHRRRQDRIGFGRPGANIGDRRRVEIGAREKIDQRRDVAVDEVAGVHAFLSHSPPRLRRLSP